MKFEIHKKTTIAAFTGALLVVFAALPAFSRDHGYSAEQLNESTQMRLQHIIEQKTAHVQQALIEKSIRQYENLLAQQMMSDGEQLAVAVSIESMPDMLEQSEELMVQAVPASKLIDCDQ